MDAAVRTNRHVEAVAHADVMRRVALGALSPRLALVPAPRGSAMGGPSEQRVAGHGRAPGGRKRFRARPAHRPRTRDCSASGDRAHQQAHRREALLVQSDGRNPPVPRLPQTWDHLARRPPRRPRRTPSEFSLSARPLQRAPVPAAEFGGRLVGALAEREQRGVGVRRGAHGAVGQEELAEAGVVEGVGGPDRPGREP